MEDAIKQMLTAIPQYLLNFFKLIGSPIQFPLDKLPKSDDQAKDRLTEALAFLAISFVISVLLNSSATHVEITWNSLSLLGLRQLILIIVFGFALYLGWRIFGSKQSYILYLIAYSYQIGIGLIIVSLFNVLSWGYLKTFNSELYVKVIAAIKAKKTYPELDQDTDGLICICISILGYVLFVIWSWISWGVYRISNNFNKSRSIAVLMVAGLFAWIAFAIIYVFNNVLSN